jgi:hypothetical protein
LHENEARCLGWGGSYMRREGEEFPERRSNCKDLGNPGNDNIELEVF